MHDLCITGPLTKDIIKIKGKPKTTQPGGTVYYTSLACQALGAKVAVVTKLSLCDKKNLTDPLEQKGISVYYEPVTHTCVFENHYLNENTNEREQRACFEIPSFHADFFLKRKARCFYWGGLLRSDFEPLFFEKVCKQDPSLQAIDLQGLLRVVESGVVVQKPWGKAPEILKHMHVVKANEAEARIFSGKTDLIKAAQYIASCGPKEVVITRGDNGSLIFADGVLHEIPAVAKGKTADTTGCGDTYMAGYLFTRLRGMGIKEAGLCGAEMAGLKATKMGALDNA